MPPAAREIPIGPRPHGCIRQDTRAGAQDIIDLFVAGCARRENDWREGRDFHFAGGLCPTNEFIQIIQGKRAQNLLSEVAAATVQIVIAQHEAQCF